MVCIEIRRRDKVTRRTSLIELGHHRVGRQTIGSAHRSRAALLFLSRLVKGTCT